MRVDGFVLSGMKEGLELYRLETGRCLKRVRTRLFCDQSGFPKTAFGWCGAVDG